MDAAALGSVFLLAALSAAYLGDGDSLAKVDANIAVATLVGGIGIGALIDILGGAVWRGVFGYNRRPFRTGIASESPIREVVARVAPKLGDGGRAMLATSFEFHPRAGAIAEWTRRRHLRAQGDVKVLTALVLGLLFSFFIASPHWPVLVAAAIVGSFALVDARGQEAEAEAMEALWFDQNPVKPPANPGA